MEFQRVFVHDVVLDSDKSVTLQYKGNATNAELHFGGNIIDKVDIFGKPEGELPFLSGAPIHCGLVGLSKFSVRFYSTDNTAPVITYIPSETTLSWKDIDNKEYYYQNVELNDMPVKNNMLLFTPGDYGLCSLRYAH